MKLTGGGLRRSFGISSVLIGSLVAAWTDAGAEVRPAGTNYLAARVGPNRLAAPATNLTQLLQCLVGPDVQVSNATLSASPQAAGTFAGALDVIGFDQGVILSSGDVQTLTGPNLADSTSTVSLSPGDLDLDGLIPGYMTFDSVVLEFDFTCSTAQAVVFQYVFGSEEYNEYVNSPFNDVFGFFLNGANIAVAPAGCSGAGAPVSINNVNCGNPYAGVGPNCNCFRNNDLTDGGGSINTELDGLTQVFLATGAIQAGANHIKIALADAGDQVLDSDVMIRCQSFTCGAPPVTGACCLPAGPCVTLTSADCVSNGGTYHGDASSCVPSPCGTSSGACCLANNACEVESPDSCNANGGIYQGDVTQCVPNPCGAPVAACCFGSGVCELTDAFSCIGTHLPLVASCDPNPCANLTGACCADAAVCEVGTLAQCGGDTFLGIGTNCDPNPCDAIVGACCHDNGTCGITLQSQCTGGDVYMGNRTVCDPSPCGANPNQIFVDGFELGTTGAWSTVAA